MFFQKREKDFLQNEGFYIERFELFVELKWPSMLLFIGNASTINKFAEVE